MLLSEPRRGFEDGFIIDGVGADNENAPEAGVWHVEKLITGSRLWWELGVGQRQLPPVFATP